MIHLSEDAKNSAFLTGVKLSEEQSVKLEAELEAAPETQEARLTLLAYYFSRIGKAEINTVRRRHIEWFIHNEPNDDVAGGPLASIHAALDPDGYKLLKDEWLKQIELYPHESQVLVFYSKKIPS